MVDDTCCEHIAGARLELQGARDAKWHIVNALLIRQQLHTQVFNAKATMGYFHYSLAPPRSFSHMVKLHATCTA